MLLFRCDNSLQKKLEGLETIQRKVHEGVAYKNNMKPVAQK